MIEPFDRKKWIRQMTEEFERFTSHEYEPEDFDHTVNNKNEHEKDKKCSCKGTDRDNKVDDVNLMSKEKCKKENNEDRDQLWIGDTGASCHMTNSMQGIVNIRTIDSYIVLGNGEQLKATHVGDKKGYVLQKDGTRKQITLQKVKFVLNLACNLFSISAALQSGCEMEGTSKNIKIKKGRREYILIGKSKVGKEISMQ